MNFWHAALLGLVEGLTEFLPVSSTGHLVLASRVLGLSESEFLKTFQVAIQSGAMLAVLALYGKKFWVEPRVLALTAAAFVPTAAIGLALHELVRNLLGHPDVVLASFFWGGVAILVFEAFHKESVSCVTRLSDMRFRQALWIGLCQSLALVPGVSRSAATILGGLACGLSRPAIVEFSFLLAVPTLLAATGLDLVKTSASFTGQQWQLLALGTGVSFVVAIAAMRSFLKFVRSNSFRIFGIYRILAAGAGWLWLR